MSPRPDDDLDLQTADLLRGALHREADAVRPSPDGLARILAATRATEPAQGPSTVELPAVGRLPDRDAPGAADLDGPPEDAPGAGLAAVVRRFVPRPRSGSRPARPDRPGRLTRWTPALTAAAAVVLLASGLGAVRLGVIHAPGLAAVVGARDTRQDRQPTAPPALPIYLVSREQGRWALVREFTPTGLTDAGQRLDAALRLAVAGTAIDRDLTSVWATEQLTGEVHGEITAVGITIHLSGDLLATRQPSTERTVLARLAVQQLVWTATAVAAPGHDGPVRIEGPSAASALLGEVPLGRAFTRSVGDADPRAPVWVSSLVDGQRLRTGTATVGGDATTTEAGTVEWELAGPDGATVATGSQRLARADGGTTPPRVGERSVFQLHLTLTVPGTYRLVVTQRWPWTTDPNLVWSDTKTLQVAG